MNWAKVLVVFYAKVRRIFFVKNVDFLLLPREKTKGKRDFGEM